ncbi:phage portal protein [Elstera sp.]|jgi:lambda family phage portal protein|uniref:phage portal protein n=1 Tax=Elstera sp. TaxID=1916664 RepID=UPI0037BF8DD8
MLEKIKRWWAGSPAPPPVSHRRGIEAGAGGYRFNGARPLHDMPREIERAGGTVRARAQNLLANDCAAATAGDQITAQLVGSGIIPRPLHPAPERRDTLLKAYSRWSRRADAEGLLDCHGLQAAAVRSMAVAGEAFVRLEIVPSAAGGVPLRLRLLDPRLIPTLDQALPDGAKIRAGVEFDASGQRVAYHLRPLDTSTGFETIRVPAGEMLHLFRPIAPGQVRGLSWFSPTLTRFQDVSDLQDARLYSFKAAALFCATLEKPILQEGFTGEQTDVLPHDLGLMPGAIFNFAPGEKLTFNSPPSPDESYEHYLAALQTGLAAALGLTYEQLTGDTSRSNYSSSRIALINQRRFLDMVQHHVIIPQLIRPVWEKFVSLAIASGAVPAPDYSRFPDDYLNADFHPPAWEWVDPEKEINAEQAAIQAGLKSRAQAVSERGYDIETIDEQRSADRAREARLGLTKEENP